MRVRDRLSAAAAAAVSIGAVVALASAGGAGAAPAPITLGSTTGTPSMNVASCAAGITCTFVPYDSVGAPTLLVPADGTITSFTENFPGSGLQVQLRVLRPAGGGKFTGAGTSATETSTASGVQSFAVSLPVKAGDVLGLNNSQSNLLFDNTTDPERPVLGYYVPTPLADGSTRVPERVEKGLRLPLSAVLQPSGTTTTTSSTVTTTVTRTVTTSSNPSGRAPSLSGVTQSATAWRRSGRVGPHRPPVGTRFSFRVNAPSTVTITFYATGKRSAAKGRLAVRARAGTNRVAFRGTKPRLRPGTYTAVFTAADSAGRSSAPAALSFTIVR